VENSLTSLPKSSVSLSSPLFML